METKRVKLSMKVFCSILLFFLLFSCNENNAVADNEEVVVQDQQLIRPAFQRILDSANVIGSILIYDPQKAKYYSNDFVWAEQQQLPASTFKVVNSIIALETEVVENDSTLFKWDGQERALKNWEQDLVFRDAFHFSCVPCYQEVARKIGLTRMIGYLDRFNYGNMKVDSTNLDLFWLVGDSRINQFQQIDFLKRLYESQLPISERTEELMKKLIVIEENENYRLSGKTGWSVANEIDNGWFVGYVESQSKVYFFATNVEPQAQFDMNNFAIIRKDVTYEALKQLEII